MSDRGKVLKVAVRAFEPFERALEKIWASYCEETHCDLQLEIVPMELGPLHNEILDKNGLKKGDWDIAHINTDWIAEAWRSDAVENLQPYLQKNPPEDYPKGWSVSLLNMQKIDDAVVGLPFHDGPECLMYRKDLFENSDEQEKYRKEFDKELKPPRTWQDFMDIAHFFHRPESNLFGAVFAAYPDGHNTVFDFCLQLWTRGGELTDGNDTIVIDTPAAKEGLKFYRAMLRDDSAVHPGCADFDSVKAGLAFARGEVAMMVNWFGFASLCEVHEQSKTKGKVDITTIPHAPAGRDVSLNVYWLYAIGSGSLHKQTAYDFIKYAVNPQNDKLLTLEGGIGCRLSTWSDPEVNRIIPYYHRLEELHEKARELPCRSDWDKITKVIDQVVLDVANTNLPINEILKTGQQKINQLQNDDRSLL